ncbi:MAG: hypothetical protein RIG82_05115 [Phycisphaeraceae bacterium]
MPKLTVFVGLLLVILGVVMYATAGGSANPAPADHTAAIEEGSPADALPSPRPPEVAHDDAGDVASAAGAETGERKKPSITALIPAFIGAPILLLGLASMNEGWRRHALHGAMIFALLGTLGGLGMGLPAVPKLIAGEHERPKAVYSQIGMGVPCAVLLIAGINSFVRAGRARRAAAQASADA